MTNERDKQARARRTPPHDEPAEAVERIVSRRKLKVVDGDVLIVRTSGGFRPDASLTVYQLRVQGHGFLSERFAGFEHAAVAGERFAQSHKVRLFFEDSEAEAPFLLQDFR